MQSYQKQAVSIVQTNHNQFGNLALQEMKKSTITIIQKSAAFYFYNTTEITTKEVYIATFTRAVSLCHK